MLKFSSMAVIVGSTLTLAACGGGGGGSGSGGARYLGTINVPNVTESSRTFSYDAGQVSDGLLYLTDRNNKSVDVVEALSRVFIAQITGTGATAFTGDGRTPDQSGPNSVNKVGANKMYATDVNSLKIIDLSVRKITGVIPIFDATGLPTGNRADGSCLDKNDNILMTQNSADNFATWIDTTTDTVIARFDFPDNTQGLEVCVYDPVTRKFFVNNDGTDSNPDGELDSFDIGSILARKPFLSDRFPLAKCNPNGLDLGPGNDIVVACDPSVGGIEGRPLITLILDRTNGKVLSTVPFGGSDLVAYDAVSNRYFLGSRNWQASGIFSKAEPKVPSLGIIDAATRKALQPLQAGKGAHSVVLDSVNAQVFVPYAPTPGDPIFKDGGIAFYSTR